MCKSFRKSFRYPFLKLILKYNLARRAIGVRGGGGFEFQNFKHKVIENIPKGIDFWSFFLLFPAHSFILFYKIKGNNLLDHY